MGKYILEAEGLSKSYKNRSNAFGIKKNYKVAKVLDNVSFKIEKGEILGLVGESGCGKSTICNILLGLMTPDRGTVKFDGIDIINLSNKEMQPFRRRIQAVFQDTSSSLNPRMKVKNIIAEPLKNFNILNSLRVEELLEMIGLSKESLDKYPHEFSGGQRQRIAIARAIALKPDLIILDEPTSNLDVLTAKQILKLLKTLNENMGMAFLFVSHDIEAVEKLCTRIAVMKEGQIVEILERINENSAKHMYSKELLESRLILNY